jgi:hypothetical protein
MPGEEAWLVEEHRSNGEQKYYPSNLPGECQSRRAGSASKRINNSRKNWGWITSKDDPGPDVTAIP